jgi:hypothetical protein
VTELRDSSEVWRRRENPRVGQGDGGACNFGSAGPERMMTCGFLLVSRSDKIGWLI